jgi:hypothetical protein
MNNSEFKETLYETIDRMQKDGQVYDPTYQIFIPVETSKEMIDIIIDLCDEAGIEFISYIADVSVDPGNDLEKVKEISERATEIYLEKGFISKDVYDRAMQNIENVMAMA